MNTFLLWTLRSVASISGDQSLAPSPPPGQCSASGFDTNTDYHQPSVDAVGHVDASSASDCCAQCGNSTWQARGCRYWSYGAGAGCWLKTTNGGRTAKQDVTSGSAVLPLPPKPPNQYVVDGTHLDLEFDGHGGLSAGASSRLFVDYPEPQRSEVLDYLFTPQFGASLGVLKVEIGGDDQSTDGTEPSHMHARDDLNCGRGYEGWLAKEARARNPQIKIWSLSWGVPGWIGNGSGDAAYYSDDNIGYQISWLSCLRDHWNVSFDAKESGYIGMWNERDQGNEDYVIKLRKAMDAKGFENVGITLEASWDPLVTKALENPEFNASVAAASKHYPCNSTCPAALQAHKKFWAGEDTPTNAGNWTAASCWGRKLNQHFVKMRATSAVSWAVLWAQYPGASGKSPGQFLGNAFMNTTEPWTGHYDVFPIVWINAHWGQFASPGWRYLQVGQDGGAGFLDAGGSYVTLVPPDDAGYPAGTFTLIVETLQGSCGSQGKCNVDPFTETQVASFLLKGPLSNAQQVNLWCSDITEQFTQRGQVQISSGRLTLTMEPDTICTATTLTSGSKGQHPTPPASARFPARHSDDFSSYDDDALAWGFSDVYGSFAVRNGALTQVATALPTGWAPVNYDPLTFIGDEQWADLELNVTSVVNHTAPHHYVRLCGGCGFTPGSRSIKYSCPDQCCFNMSWTGNWTLGDEQGFVPNFADTHHQLGLGISGGSLAAAVDGVQVGSAKDACGARGLAGLGCGKYHMCSFSSFAVEGSSEPSQQAAVEFL